jgi:hypothetical protein
MLVVMVLAVMAAVAVLEELAERVADILEEPEGLEQHLVLLVLL